MSSLTYGILNAAFALAVLFLIFRPLEHFHAARPGQRVLRPRWGTDLCFLLGQYLFFNGAVFWLLERLQPWVYALTPQAARDAAGALPLAAQAVVVVLAGDFLIYWGHRLQHRVGFLWRFHAVHHSAEHLDWLAAHREHPVDSVYTICLVNLPIFALGFPVAALAAFAAFRGLWAIFIHANVRLPVGPLRFLVGAPDLHHWHHDRAARDSGNYANVCPVMDVIFGTYRRPDHEPAAFGIAEPVPQTYWGLICHPFRRGARK